MADDKDKKKKDGGGGGDKGGGKKPEGGGEKKAHAGGGDKKAQAKGGDGKKGGPGGGGKDKGGKKAPVADENAVVRTGPPRLKILYDKEVAPQLMKQFGYKNKMQVPKLVKITLNMGMGEALQNPKLLESAVEELTAISGQKVMVTKAKTSIATFKLRVGQKIGCMVTLRRERMYEFYDRLVNLALPRVRAFKGISPRAFDGRGNFSLGVREQIIFPEINYDQIDKIKGLNVSIVTTARTDEEGRALLKALGMPFRS